MTLRFRKEDPPPQPPVRPPFPVRVFIVGVDRNGNEVARHDTGLAITSMDQLAHMECDLRLEES